MGALSRALDLLGEIPEPILYLLLGGGAFLENIVPPVPADTRPGRPLALGLVAFFALIVLVLVGIQLATG